MTYPATLPVVPTRTDDTAAAGNLAADINALAAAVGDTITMLGAPAGTYGSLAARLDDLGNVFVTATAGGGEKVDISASVSGSKTIDLANGNAADYTLTGATTLAFSGATSGELCSFLLIARQDATGGRAITWPGSVRWLPGTTSTPPTIDTSANQVNEFLFWTTDGGATWFGSYGGGATASKAPAQLVAASAVATPYTVINATATEVTVLNTGTPAGPITIPAGTLSAVGDCVDIEVWGDLNNNALTTSSWVYKIKVGASSPPTTVAMTTNNCVGVANGNSAHYKTWVLTLSLMRIDASNVLVTSSFVAANSAASGADFTSFQNPASNGGQIGKAPVAVATGSTWYLDVTCTSSSTLTGCSLRVAGYKIATRKV